MINSIHVFSFTGVSEFNWSQITAHFSSAGPAQSKTGEMTLSVAYALSLSACATPSLSIGGEIVTLRLFETDLFSDTCFFVSILSTITFFSHHLFSFWFGKQSSFTKEISFLYPLHFRYWIPLGILPSGKPDWIIRNMGKVMNRQFLKEDR